LQDAIEHYRRAKVLSEVLSEGDNQFKEQIDLSLIEAKCEMSGEKSGEELDEDERVTPSSCERRR